MALLQRTRILPNQRLDRPDYNNIEDFTCADFKAIQKHIQASTNLIYSGFEATGTGTTTLEVALANAALTLSANDGTLYIGAPTLSNLSTSSLTPSATNYVELTIDQDTGGADSRAFWDPTASGGEGAEFSQIIDTFTFLNAEFSINSSNFTGDADKTPICEVDVNGSGVITAIRDSRSLFWRLGRPGDATFDYSWASRTEPSTTQFTGADKDIASWKDWVDAIMSSIREIKGTTYWYEAPSVSFPGSFRNAALSVLAPISATAKFSWTGTALSITDDSGAPADADVLAALRIFDVTTDLELTRQDGTGGSTAITLADGEAVFIELPDPLANTTYTGVGVVSTNYQVAARGSVPLAETTYWIAYREGSKLVVRGLGELEAGEVAEVGDNLNENLLGKLGTQFGGEAGTITYGETIRGTQGESYGDRLDVLVDNQGDYQEDRSAYISSEETVFWEGTQLEFTEDIVLEIINTKDGTTTTHTIDSGDSPLTLADGEAAWVAVDRTAASETLTVNKTGTTAIPAQTQSDKDVFVLFKRVVLTSGESVLYLPFNKQTLSEGQAVKLGAAGSGAGTVKADYYDPLSTALPTGSTVTIDGQSGVNGDLVLYGNLLSGNNRIYELGGVGVSITWTEVRAFNGQFDPEDGDSVRIQKGDSFQEQLAVFDGTDFEVNDVIRLFDGVSGDFWELGSIKTSTLTDNTVDSVFEVNVTGSENIIVCYSIARGTSKETGELYITSDGTDATVTRTNTYIGDVGVSFTADVSSGDLRLRYDTTSTGSDATMKYFLKRWSNAAGGPTGVPNYTGASGSSISAAGNIGEVQFHGSGGNLDADPKFVWDSTDDAIELNGLQYTALSSGITINDNQVSATAAFSYDAATYRFAVVEYSVERDGDYRVGRMLVSNDGTTTGFSDDFVETSSVGVTFSAVISGGNVEIRYTSTSTGFTGTFKYTIRRWQ